ncbi:MAG: hypothetical protein NC115_06195 [Bacteroidales bacterium]|nr:hypothetical protein [Bacteroidales bacterium]
MGNGEKDILATRKELKQMPFKTPEGYFDGFKVDVSRTGQDAVDRKEMFRIPAFSKISPYLAMAAMFAIIAAAGTALMKIIQPDDYLQEYGSFAYIDLIPVTDPYSIYYSCNEEYDAISEEDVIEYLINEGTSLEMIDNE